MRRRKPAGNAARNANAESPREMSKQGKRPPRSNLRRPANSGANYPAHAARQAKSCTAPKANEAIADNQDTFRKRQRPRRPIPLPPEKLKRFSAHKKIFLFGAPNAPAQSRFEKANILRFPSAADFPLLPRLRPAKSAPRARKSCRKIRRKPGFGLRTYSERRLSERRLIRFEFFGHIFNRNAAFKTKPQAKKNSGQNFVFFTIAREKS